MMKIEKFKFLINMSRILYSRRRSTNRLDATSPAWKGGKIRSIVDRTSFFLFDLFGVLEKKKCSTGSTQFELNVYMNPIMMIIM